MFPSLTMLWCKRGNRVSHIIRPKSVNVQYVCTGSSFSGVSRISQTKGAPPKFGVKTYYLKFFLPKTAWKWKKLYREGGANVPAPLGSANSFILAHHTSPLTDVSVAQPRNELLQIFLSKNANCKGVNTKHPNVVVTRDDTWIKLTALPLTYSVHPWSVHCECAPMQ